MTGIYALVCVRVLISAQLHNRNFQWNHNFKYTSRGKMWNVDQWKGYLMMAARDGTKNMFSWNLRWFYTTKNNNSWGPEGRRKVWRQIATVDSYLLWTSVSPAHWQQMLYHMQMAGSDTAPYLGRHRRLDPETEHCCHSPALNKTRQTMYI